MDHLGRVSQAEYHAALDRRQRRIKSLAVENARRRELVLCLIENDPNVPISDAGHVVLDLWRHDARKALGMSAIQHNQCHGEGRPMSDRMALQTAEFDAVAELAEQYRRLSMTAIVDDDYLSVRHDYEDALRALLDACVANGRKL